jgi:hypothetical protein
MAPRALLSRPIEAWQLPLRIPRALAAEFAGVHPRTLVRAERRGLLKAYYRNSRVVLYDRAELLHFLGIELKELN